jgi:pyruvate kinase
MCARSSDRPPADRQPGALRERLERLRAAVAAAADDAADRLTDLPDERQDAARNLLHYLALRQHDLEELDRSLHAFGLTGLAGLEAAVLPHIDAMLGTLRALDGESTEAALEPARLHPAQNQLSRNTDRLFGPRPEHRATRFMVTLPPQTASEYMTVHRLIDAGMDCARINCSHDCDAGWAAMVRNLRDAARASGRPCRILMDISGPKLRTGPMQPLPPILKIRPHRDRGGQVARPARIWLTAGPTAASERQSADACLRVDAGWLDDCNEGDKVRIRDARGASRRWRIMRKAAGGCWAECGKTTYLDDATELRLKGGGATRVANLPATESRIRVQVGDSLVMSGKEARGRAELRDDHGRLLSPGRVLVDVAGLYDDARPGEPVCFDDGRISGIIDRVGDGELEIRITHTRRAAEVLGSGRGVNLPRTRFSLPALSDADLVDLAFAAEHADLVGLSFVNRPDDVRLLHRELARLGREDIGVVLKIETRRGVRNLPEILLEAMRFESCGVMIARGDLAVECGFERLAGLQDHILAVCEAARVPVIWATQVLESLAKRGHPTRAEITDAAAGQAAECLMLNKGPYINEALRMLDTVVRDMERRRLKGRARAARLAPPEFPAD